MAKGISSNKGGIRIVAGGSNVTEDEVTGVTGLTITFTGTYIYGIPGVFFYRNGVLMDHVPSFTIGGTNNSEEYQEINNGAASTQITLNPTNPATVDELFQMVVIEGFTTPQVQEQMVYINQQTIASLASGEVTYTPSSVSGDTLGVINGTAISLPSGTYSIEGTGSAFKTNHTYLRVYDATGAILIDEGVNSFAETVDNSVQATHIRTKKFTLTIPSNIEFRVFSTAANPVGIGDIARPGAYCAKFLIRKFD